LIKASGLQQAIQANAIASFRVWALDIFQVEIDLEHTNVHHAPVEHQSIADQTRLSFFLLLHLFFVELVDWLGSVAADCSRARQPGCYRARATDACWSGHD